MPSTCARLERQRSRVCDERFSTELRARTWKQRYAYYRLLGTQKLDGHDVRDRYNASGQSKEKPAACEFEFYAAGKKTIVVSGPRNALGRSGRRHQTRALVQLSYSRVCNVVYDCEQRTHDWLAASHNHRRTGERSASTFTPIPTTKITRPEEFNPRFTMLHLFFGAKTPSRQRDGHSLACERSTDSWFRVLPVKCGSVVSEPIETKGFQGNTTRRRISRIGGA